MRLVTMQPGGREWVRGEGGRGGGRRQQSGAASGYDVINYGRYVGESGRKK